MEFMQETLTALAGATQGGASQGVSQGVSSQGLPPQGAATAVPPLQAALRSALRSGPGRVALRVAPGATHHVRLARALLQEGALAAGGQVVEGPGADLLLVGAEARRAGRLAHMLDRLLGAGVSTVFSLDRDMPALRAYAAGQQDVAPDLGGLDEWLARTGLPALVQRRQAVRPPPDAGPAEPAFQRVAVAQGLLAQRMGTLGADADLLRHAAESLAARLLLALTDPAAAAQLLGPRPGGMGGALHLPVPPAHLAPGGAAAPDGRRRLVATLDITEAAQPQALEARRAALAARGWAVELAGIDAALLPVLSLGALSADLFRIEWSEALAAPAARAALARIDPARLVVSGVDSAAALDFARAVGVHAIEGHIAEAALAARPA